MQAIHLETIELALGRWPTPPKSVDTEGGASSSASADGETVKMEVADNEPDWGNPDDSVNRPSGAENEG